MGPGEGGGRDIGGSGWARRTSWTAGWALGVKSLARKGKSLGFEIWDWWILRTLLGVVASKKKAKKGKNWEKKGKIGKKGKKS